MKKALLVFLIMVLGSALVFGSCAKEAPAPAPSPSPAPAPAPAPAPKVIKLKFAETVPPMTVVPKDLIVPWGEKIKSLTDGRVEMTLYAADSLARGPDYYDAVLAGTADLARIVPDWTPGVFDLAEAISLPLLFGGSEASSATFMELVDKYLQATEFKKVKVLWALSITPANVFEKKKQIKVAEDFKGEKLAVANQLPVRILEKMGASAVMIPVFEIFTALDRGMVDGAVENWDAAATFKWLEVTKYRTDVKMWTPGTLVIMNLDKWNSLPPDIQKIFEENSGVKASQEHGAIFDAFEQHVLDDVIVPYDKEKGNPEVYYLPQEEKDRWRQILQSLYDEWTVEKEAKGLPAKEFVNDLLALAEKYNNEIAAR